MRSFRSYKICVDFSNKPHTVESDRLTFGLNIVLKVCLAEKRDNPKAKDMIFAGKLLTVSQRTSDAIKLCLKRFEDRDMASCVIIVPGLLYRAEEGHRWEH